MPGRPHRRQQAHHDGEVFHPVAAGGKGIQRQKQQVQRRLQRHEAFFHRGHFRCFVFAYPFHAPILRPIRSTFSSHAVAEWRFPIVSAPQRHRAAASQATACTRQSPSARQLISARLTAPTGSHRWRRRTGRQPPAPPAHPPCPTAGPRRSAAPAAPGSAAAAPYTVSPAEFQ